jgi:GNAT superfamily N-acetyltransferase
MSIRIVEIYDEDRKTLYAKEILRSLPEWFNEETICFHAENVRKLPFWAALENDDKHVGFLGLKTHYGQTGQVCVCGVLSEYHNEGIGKKLFTAAEENLRQSGCKYFIVKTLSDLAVNEPYERTRKFYSSVGFEPLLTLTEIWDEEHPCLIMIKNLK